MTDQPQVGRIEQLSDKPKGSHIKAGCSFHDLDAYCHVCMPDRATMREAMIRQQAEEIKRLKAENEELHRLNQHGYHERSETLLKIKRLKAENNRLKKALKE